MTVREHIIENARPEHREAVRRALDATDTDFEVLVKRIREGAARVRARIDELLAAQEVAR